MTLTYDKPRKDAHTTRIPSGTAAFRAVVRDHFGYARTEVVRDKARCGTSEHCEARAVDLFTTDHAKGRRLFDWCVRNADPLGIQSVIFWRRVWGFGKWYEHAYTGSSPHTDHVHVGLNWNAARTLTTEKVRNHLTAGPTTQEPTMDTLTPDRPYTTIPILPGDREVVLATDLDGGATVRLAIGHVAGGWQGTVDTLTLREAEPVTRSLPPTAKIVGVRLEAGHHVTVRIVR